VYLILGRLFKLHPDFENAMFEILNRDKCGRIVLITERARHLNQVVYGRLRSTALSKGYEEELTRIHFVAYWNYVRVLAHGTIVLDTFPYGGCLTAQEGMSNGKIVVTLPGSYVRGRFTKMIYEQMGGGKNEQGWAPIASTTEEFVEMAVKLGTDVTIRQSVKSAINSEWSTVGKDAEVAAEWSEFFVRAWLGIQTK
jgi:protein O-GlcNAc transferase